MTQINFGRLEHEITNRLRGEFRNPVAERLLRDRCVNAVKLRSIDQAELFSGIIVSKVRIIKSEQVIDTLKSSGVLDLVSICINAQEGN
ncbi:MAG: hypothetical protein J6B87_01380 [Clostridia bacterium]|nr:hypothetical protein [Clostridia bacterium]